MQETGWALQGATNDDGSLGQKSRMLTYCADMAESFSEPRSGRIIIELQGLCVYDRARKRGFDLSMEFTMKKRCTNTCSCLKYYL